MNSRSEKRKPNNTQKILRQSVTNSGMGRTSLFLATTTIQRKGDRGGLNKRDEDHRRKERSLLSRDPPRQIGSSRTSKQTRTITGRTGCGGAE